MSADMEQLRDEKEFAVDSSESKGDSDSADSIRSEIGRFLDDKDFRKTLDTEALGNYEELIRKQGKDGSDKPENLRKFYKFLKEQWDEVQAVKDRMKGHMEKAVREGVISDKDRRFYDEKMDENVLTGKQNVTSEIMVKAEKDLTDSLENRRKERQQYDELVQGPLVKDGTLKIDAKTAIKVPDEKEFLKMSVPERRKFLKQAEEAMPKARKYAEKHDEAESLKLIKDYADLLKKAEKDGLISKATIDKFMEAFRKIGLPEKQHWMQELTNGNQLKRYKDLWTDIRKTLKGPALKCMESLRDKMGYTQLLQEFGRVQERESLNTENRYGGMLKQAHKKKIISRHTYNAFMQDMKKQPFSEKQRYLESFPMQMRRYEALRAKIDQMKDKGARKALDGMYESGEYGYTEIEAKYSRLAGASADAGSLSDNETDKELNAIENRSVRSAVKEGLDDLGLTQKVTLAQKLTSFFEGRLSEKEDAFSYQKNLRQARQEQSKVNEKEVTGRRPSREDRPSEPARAEKEDENIIRRGALSRDETDDTAVPRRVPEGKSQNTIPEEMKNKVPYQVKTEINRDKTFVKKTFRADTDAKNERNVARAQINSADGVQSLNADDSLNRETDSLSVMVWVDNRPIELRLNEIRATVRFLRKDILRTIEPGAERMAA